MRTGLLAKKVGMSRIYDDAGNFVPVTVLEVKDSFVLGQKTTDKHGYSAVQVGLGNAKEKNTSKPLLGFFKKLNMNPLKKIVEFRVSEENLLDVGTCFWCFYW